MPNRRDWIVDLITEITGDKIKSEAIIEVLQFESVLQLGYGKPEVDAIVETFSNIYGTTKTSKYDRFAADRLAKKYGAKAICGIIKLLSEHAQDKYCPVVNNLTQLEEKIPSILNFLRNVDTDEEIIDA